MQRPKSLLRTIKRKLLPGLGPNPGVRRIGEFISFKESGFVAADSPADLLFRHYYEQRELRRMLGELNASQSLEIGCGYGRLSPIIAEYSKRHVAVDVNPDAVAIGRKHYPQVEFHVCSATELPFDSDSFDVVITWTVLQHIPPSHIERATSHIVRLARPGATLILLEATRFHDQPEIQAGGHTFDRAPATYEKLLEPFHLVESKWIEEIHAVHPYGPGQLMILR